MKAKILVISDTHGNHKRWLKLLEENNFDYCIHAGDHLESEQFMDTHATFWVAGNNDFIGEDIQTFKICDKKFILFHGHQAIDFHRVDSKKIIEFAKDYAPDVIVFGHTHQEYLEWIDGTLVINPGSLVAPRNKSFKPSYAVIEINDSKITPEIHYYKSW